MSKDTIIDEIERELINRGWKKKQFCTAMSISTQQYNNWRTRGVPSRRLNEVADFFKWNAVKLHNGVVEPALIIAEETPTYSAENNLLTRINALPTDLRANVLAVINAQEMIAAERSGNQAAIIDQTIEEYRKFFPNISDEDVKIVRRIAKGEGAPKKGLKTRITDLFSALNPSRSP